VRHTGFLGTSATPIGVTPPAAGDGRVVHADPELGVVSHSVVVDLPRLFLGVIVDRAAVVPVPDLGPRHAGSRSQDAADPALRGDRVARLREELRTAPGLSRPWKPC